MHGGSENHGCEAIVRTTAAILKNETISVYSRRPDKDIEYGLDKICNIKDRGTLVKRGSPMYLKLQLQKRILKKQEAFTEIQYKNIFDNISKEDLFLSIGGDNYCGQLVPTLKYINNKINVLGGKTALWGCSIEPDYIYKKDSYFDLQQYAFITARESLTYQALCDIGLQDTTYLLPDPAFLLPVQEVSLPENFVEGRTVGINISPLIQQRENGKNVAYKNYQNLIQYIIEKTDNNILLIPHVIWNESNDLIPIETLYEQFKSSGRVCKLQDSNCCQLKYAISKCRFMVVARTHASIAAYSTEVPTLVIGYSVKSKGIAKDIFGTFDNYVLPVQNLQNESELQQAFQWVEKNENEIRSHLKQFMPAFIERVRQAETIVQKTILGRSNEN